jgi:hypothetical protein
MSRPRNPVLERVWRERLDRQAASGLSISAFCEREGVSSASFHSWKRRLAERSFPALPEPSVFLPVRLSSQATEGSLLPTPRVEVELPHQVRLHFENAPEPEWLGRLVAVMSDLRSHEEARS